MVIQVESYRKQNSIEKKNFEPDKKREELLKHLGLKAQLAFDTTSVYPSAFYPNISGYELKVWLDFLRTAYSKNMGHWNKYRFDCIPTDALEQIQFAESLHLFNDLEIWTPEQPIDPMVVGVLGDRQETLANPFNSAMHGRRNVRFFQIVRWGESLKPFEAIEKEVLHQKIRSSVSPVPQKILDYIIERFRKDGLGASILGRTIFARHCGKRMYKIQFDNPHCAELVCSICCYSRSTSCWCGSGNW